MSVHNCEKCCIFKAKPQIPAMESIICTEPLDLVHIDYVSMEVTVGVQEKPVMKNVLVVHTLHSGVLHKQPHGVHHNTCAVQ